ncbi:UNVERIFIED_CONTAM: hypothetical protein FKN15_053105 [Acipenser sinensis]
MILCNTITLFPTRCSVYSVHSVHMVFCAHGASVHIAPWCTQCWVHSVRTVLGAHGASVRCHFGASVHAVHLVHGPLDVRCTQYSVHGAHSIWCTRRTQVPSVLRYLGARGAQALPCLTLCARRSEDKVTVHFINRDGEKITSEGKIGDSLLDVVVNKNLDIDGFGACEGTLACSTCHLIFDENIFKQLDPITDEEMDMLDLAYGLTETSRLGCQICLSKSMNGMTVSVPEGVADVRQAADMGLTPS